MRTGRLLLRLAAVTGVALVAMSPVAAQAQYAPPPPALVASSTTVTVGGVVTLTGTGFGPFEPVLITVTTTPLALDLAPAGAGGGAPVTAVPAAWTATKPEHWGEGKPKRVVAFTDANGAFTEEIRLYRPGRATITATGKESGITASVVVTVLGKGLFKGQLPQTGTSAGWLVPAGAAATGAGALLLVAGLLWRRRRGAKLDA